MARILLADDEAAIREYVARALANFGHEVTAVSDGGEALEVLRSGDFELLIADIVMPVLDGIALALKTVALYPDLPIILMTGYSAEAQRAKNLDRLVEAVVSKPFTVDEIGGVVKSTLEGGAGGTD